MAKIVIIAPSEADDDVKDAVKLLKAAGYDVDTEEPSPKSLLHIVLGLMGPNAYGFGPGYVFGPSASGSTPPADTGKDDDDTDGDSPDLSLDDGDSADDDSGTAGDEDIGDDFNFESLGSVKVDGELIEAVTHDSETSVLCVEHLTKGAKTTYTLNESSFSFWPASAEAPQQRVEVLVDKHRTSVELPIVESEGKSVLKVGKDLRSMFPAKK